ncbi:hypothetical protein ACS0TY_017215 [Phlomoides rotata]
MDPRTHLDYALFQLTPTRTRCDLVIFAGKKSEKIASGLLEPFISHLKSAKDQISKGGYSITLKPTSSDASPWFTKATLERFVRFVSTPEVLERFVTTEREINQIESSIESNEHANGTIEVQGTATASDGDPRTPLAPSKYKAESSCDYDAEAEEKPKIRLRRVLETRKAMLKKEQAMAYARALVTGFEMDYIYDLVSFSDAFGALRLREACINFIELCKKKNDDKIWMDEVAAMQASYLGTSGIILAGENNDVYLTGPAKSSAFDSITRHGSLDTSEGTDNGLEFNLQHTEGANQLPTWPNHLLPQYMQNPQGQMFQQVPSYPGYMFPGMQVPPSHYPGNVPWPANFHDSGMYLNRDINDSKRSKSFNKKKEKFANHVRRHSTKDEGGEVDQSSSGSDSSDEQDHDHDANLSPDERTHNKKQNRRSSRKVVIRNINYITKGRNEEGGSDSESSSSDEDEYVDAGSIKQQVEAAVGSLKRQKKTTAHKNKVRDDGKKASNKSKNETNSDSNSKEERKDGNWDIFQNLLMRDSDSNSKDMGSKTIQVQEEYSFQKACGEELSSSLGKPKYASDDFILTERSTRNGTEGTNEKFESRENFGGVFRRAKDEELLMPSRADREYHPKNGHFGNESSIIKTKREEDWIIGSKPEIYANPGGSTDHNIFRGEQTSTNHFQIEENKRDVLLDDSFMVQSRISDGPLQTQPKADIFMVADIVGANQPENSVPGNSRGNAEAGNFCEPEDFSMMLGAAKKVVPSWKPEMDYGNDISIYETVKSRPNTKPNDRVDATPVDNGNASKIRNSKEPGRKVPGKVPKSKAPSGSLVRSKSDIPPRSKLPAAGSRGKAEKEDEKKKRMEELLKQRQKRIAERSAAKGGQESSKMTSKENKKSPVSTKTEKAKPQVPTDENKISHKPVMRSSTIDRLATARTTNKQLPTKSKVGQNRNPTSKVTATPLSKKTKGTPEQQEKVNRSDKSAVANNSTSNSSNIPIVLEESRSAEETLRENAVRDFGTVKELRTVSSVEKKEATVLSTNDALEDKISVKVSSDRDVHSSDHVDDRVGIAPQITVHPTVENDLKSTVSKTDEKGGEKKKLSFSPEILVMNISTPPYYSEMSPELHSRKKWNNGESSPKIPRGFRKLLLFGRRS